MLIQISIIAGVFLLFSFYAFFNIMHHGHMVNKEDKNRETKRKILKRKNSNVYDLKATRKK